MSMQEIAPEVEIPQKGDFEGAASQYEVQTYQNAEEPFGDGDNDSRNTQPEQRYSLNAVPEEPEADIAGDAAADEGQAPGNYYLGGEQSLYQGNSAQIDGLAAQETHALKEYNCSADAYESGRGQQEAPAAGEASEVSDLPKPDADDYNAAAPSQRADQLTASDATQPESGPGANYPAGNAQATASVALPSGDTSARQQWYPLEQYGGSTHQYAADGYVNIDYAGTLAYGENALAKGGSDTHNYEEIIDLPQPNVADEPYQVFRRRKPNELQTAYDDIGLKNDDAKPVKDVLDMNGAQPHSVRHVKAPMQCKSKSNEFGKDITSFGRVDYHATNYYPNAGSCRKMKGNRSKYFKNVGMLNTKLTYIKK